MALNVKTRWGAFAIHLAISVLILIALLAVIFFIWFPRDLIFAGGVGGLKILMGVDLVLGPLLTLIVYQQGKKSLKMDLTVIGLLQFACLAAGLWLIFNERPQVQVLADDGIHLLAASDFKYYEIEPPELPGPSPKYVLLDLPEDRGQLNSIKFTSEFVEEKPFAFRDDLYLPMADMAKERFDSRISFIQDVMEDDNIQTLPAKKPDECAWVPVHSKHVLGYACVSFKNGIIRLSDRQY